MSSRLPLILPPFGKNWSATFRDHPRSNTDQHHEKHQSTHSVSHPCGLYRRLLFHLDGSLPATQAFVQTPAESGGESSARLGRSSGCRNLTKGTGGYGNFQSRCFRESHDFHWGHIYALVFGGCPRRKFSAIGIDQRHDRKHGPIQLGFRTDVFGATQRHRAR